MDGSYALGDEPGREAHRASLYPAFLAAAFAFSRSDFPGFARVAQGALGCLAVLLAWWLGRRLGGDWAGLIAGVLLAAAPAELAAEASLNVHFLFGLMVLLVAVALCLWAEDPTPRRTLAAGLAIGLSLACRSSLVLLPAALGAWMLQGRAFGRSWALLAAGCALPLLPWAARNAVVLGELVPFERHAAQLNLFMASLGEVDPAGGDDRAYRLSEDLAPELKGASADLHERAMLRLAAQRLRQRPGLYLAGVAGRLKELAGSLWGCFPLPLAVLGAAAFWLGSERRRKPVQALVLLVAYFLAAHALIWCNGLYVRALIPLVCVLSGCGLASAARRLSRAPAPKPAVRKAVAPLWAAGAAGAALFGASVFFLGADAVAAAHPERIASTSGERCVGLGLRASKVYASGDLPGAAASYTLALSAEPGCPELWESRGVVLSLLGRDAEALADYDRAASLVPPAQRRSQFYQALLSSRAQSRSRLRRGGRS